MAKGKLGFRWDDGKQSSSVAPHHASVISKELDASAAKEQGGERRRGQTLRLPETAWKQLKMLAVDRGVPAHDLLIEAVNDLFQKHGKPPIA